MADEVAVSTRHKFAADRAYDWQKIRDFLAGQRIVKTQGVTYLPKLPGQGRYSVDGAIVDEYMNYLMRATPLTAYVHRVFHGLTGMVFRRDPKFEVPSGIEEQLDNITLAGETAKAFARQVFQENIATSFGGILVDFSPVAERPYQRLYCAESIVNWRYEIVDDAPQLTQLILDELRERPHPSGFGAEVIHRYIILEKEPFADAPVTRRIIEREPGERVVYTEIVQPNPGPSRRGEPLTFIPFVPFNFRRAGHIEILQPALLELVDLVHAHYLLDADLKNLLHYCGAGIFLFGAGFSEQEQKLVKVGSGNYFFSTNPAAQLSYVQTNGEAGTELRAEIEGKKREMAVAFARLLLSEQQRTAETAEAQMVAFAGDDATLQGIVRATEEACSLALRIHAWWAGTAESWTEEAVEVEFNDDFITSQMSTDDLVRLGTELEQFHISYETYYWNLSRGERTIPGRTMEEEQKAIEEQKRERLAAQQQQQKPFNNVRGINPNVKNGRPANGGDEDEDEDEVTDAEMQKMAEAMRKNTMPRGGLETLDT